jgi:uncharacterized protein (DUF433 family)
MRYPASNIVAAFTEDQVTRLTGVSKRQLRWWDDRGFFPPAFAHEDRSEPYSRLYSFRDLVALRVLNALRNEHKVPLQELRRVKKRLSHMGDDLWTHTTLFVNNKKVAIRNPKSGMIEEVVGGQGVIRIALTVVASDMRKAVEALRERGPEAVGQITKQRGLLNGRPVFAGTRIPVGSVKAFAEAGYSEKQILREYPTLTIDDVRAAMIYPSAA